MSLRNIGEVFVLSVMVAACSNGGNSNNAPNDKKPEVVSESSPNKDQYNFDTPTCSTGAHHFSYPTAEELKKNLCDRLVDGKANNYCAEGERQDLFRLKCTGQAWIGGRTGTPENIGSVVLGSPWEQEIFFVESSFVVRNLTEKERETVLTYVEKIADCGLRFFGCGCEDFHNGGYTVVMFNQWLGVHGRHLVMLPTMREFSIPDGKDYPIFVYRLDENQTKYSPQTLTVYQPRVHVSWMEQHNNPDNLKPLFSVKIAADRFKFAWERLQKPPNVRAFYHAYDLLWRETNWSHGYGRNDKIVWTDPKRQDELLRSIEDNAEMISKSNDLIYQKRIFTDFIERDMRLFESDSLLRILEKFLSSNGEEIRLLSAITIAERYPEAKTDHRVKAIVAQAMQFRTPEQYTYAAEIRGRAFRVMASWAETDSEENFLIEKMAEHLCVAREDSKHFKNVNNNNNLPSIRNILSNPDIYIKSCGVNLLRKIDTREATIALIGVMGDPDENSVWLSRNAYVFLEERKLDKGMIPDLKKNLSNQQWEVRRYTARLLGKISDPQAVEALKAQLAIETNEDVKKEIETTIKTAESWWGRLHRLIR